jgi:FAD/FMN-containing dehydrogenase
MDVVWRGDRGFEEAAYGRLFNARRPDREPAAVTFPKSDDDVSTAVVLARDRGMKVAVRSGGHSWAAWSVRDDALLVDLGRMRSIAYDPDTGIAVANPAVQGGHELTPFLDRHRRMFPAGHCASVGLGGFLLQGGQGWNSRHYGWACQSVVAIDVITADGKLVHADENEHSDLLWAARGAGPGFFGVVTRFYLRTYRKPQMAHDTWTFALDDLEPLLDWMHALLPRLERVVEPVIAATRLPDLPLRDGVARPNGPLLLLHTTATAHSRDDLERVLRPFDSCPLADRALFHQRGPTSIVEENKAQVAQNPDGYRYAADCTWTDLDAGELAPLLRAMWSELDTEHSFSIWYGWGPTGERPDMAFSVEGTVNVAAYAIWSDPADDERYRDWVHRRIGAIAATGGKGVYLGDTDFTRRPDRFLADPNFERLQSIRAQWDPDDLFCSYLIDSRAELNVRAK